MRKLYLTLVCIAVALGSVGSADASKQYRTYMGCAMNTPSSSCVGGTTPGAGFENKSGKRTGYHLCFRGPTGEKDCGSYKTNRSGEDFVYITHFAGEGTYSATWKVGGDFVGRDKMELLPGD